MASWLATCQQLSMRADVRLLFLTLLVICSIYSVFTHWYGFGLAAHARLLETTLGLVLCTIPARILANATVGISLDEYGVLRDMGLVVGALPIVLGQIGLVLWSRYNRRRWNQQRSSVSPMAMPTDLSSQTYPVYEREQQRKDRIHH